MLLLLLLQLLVILSAGARCLNTQGEALLSMA
jgi:hypothetical protein